MKMTVKQTHAWYTHTHHKNGYKKPYIQINIARHVLHTLFLVDDVCILNLLGHY